MSANYLRGTHVRIAAVLDTPKTVAEIAQVLGSSYEAVSACLTGMRNRREVVALKPAKQGKPRRYRLREAAA